MLDFFVNVIFFTLAIYGFVEIIKKIYNIYTYTRFKSDGIYLIVATKNQEKQIEGFLRNTLFRIVYGKEEMINQIMVADLGSIDKTKEIVDKMEKDYNQIKSVDWSECKDILENVNDI